MSIWGVKPEAVRLNLVYAGPDGKDHPFWIEVKKFLTVGEERRVLTAGWKGMSRHDDVEAGQAGTSIDIDWKAQTFARAATYLVDWSLKDDGFKLNRDTIESLDSAVYGLIEDAITKHVEEMVEEKKAQKAKPEPSLTSV